MVKMWEQVEHLWPYDRTLYIGNGKDEVDVRNNAQQTKIGQNHRNGRKRNYQMPLAS